MTDPFLIAHRVLPRFYLIGHPVSPISIRDQMVRGCMVIQRAFENRLIDANKVILVVGAGAGGASAAIRAADLGATVYLVDIAPGPFLVQARARSRWLDPTQYDWPAEQWNTGFFPWRLGVRMPLLYPASRAHRLAAGWTVALHAAAAAPRFAGRLFIHYSTTVKSITPVSLGFDVTMNWPSGRLLSRFDFILWAAGFGKEICEIPTLTGTPYRGHPFWDTDKFELPDCGVKSPAKPRVVITGSGDGALQDLLRIATKLKSAEEIYHRAKIPSDVTTRLAEHEDRARREMSWSDGAQHDHEIHQMLDQEYRREVERALGFYKVQAGLRTIFRNPVEKITLAYPCDHLNPQLGLNRFLAHLIHEYFTTGQSEFSPSSITFLPKVSAIQVSSSTHTCAGPRTCHGQTHTIYLEEKPICYKPSTRITPSISPLTAEVLVVRYGIDRSSIKPPLPPHLLPFVNLERSRHILPYHPRP